MNEKLLALILCGIVVCSVLLLCLQEMNEKLARTVTAILAILMIYLVLRYG